MFGIVLAGKPRSIPELAAAANTILRETNCEDLADGAQSMAVMIAAQRQELKKLREQLRAQKPLVVLLPLDIQIPPGALGGFAEEIREALARAVES